MNAISSRFYQTILARLDQLAIRGNRHKVAVYAPLHPDPASPKASGLTLESGATTVVAFQLMFERNTCDSPWRLVTPLKLIGEAPD
ncbi:hypothetical protein [Spirosoma arcticum]